jgi:outer membrane protein assembly factor BamB
MDSINIIKNSLWFRVALGCGIWLVSFAVRGADWPQFLGPDRNGISSETNLAAGWPAQDPPVRWKKDVGQGFSGPVVAHGKVILFHRRADKEIVDCLDAKTGGDVWRFSYPTAYEDDFGFDPGPRGTPAIADGKVYTMGAEGAVHCVDFQTGKEVWHLDCKKQFQCPKGYFGMACSPLVEGGLVILNIGGRDGAGIIALDKMTGALRWKQGNAEAGYSSPIAANISGKRYALVFTRAGLSAVNSTNGAACFDFPWRSGNDASVNAATPVISGNLIFLTASYGTGAVLLRMEDGGVQKVWSGDESLSCHYATPVLYQGYLYGVDGRADPGMQPRPSLRCVEMKTGHVAWSQENFGAATVTLAGGQLFILTENGELIRGAADPKVFQPVARAQILPLGVRAYPALADGCLFARSKDKLVCVKMTND